MKFTYKKCAAIVAAAVVAVTMAGCASGKKEEVFEEETGVYFPSGLPETTPSETNPPEVTPPETEGEGGENAGANEIPPAEVPKVKTVSYVSVTTDGVNIRSGAGTNTGIRGTAQKSTMYADGGQTDGWYKTGYKNGTAYISSKYCERVEMAASENQRIEAVIAEGTKLLGTVYVFGAVRYHDGEGHRLKGFTVAEFDCSSLMQYIFYKGAGVNLQVNTRTQVYQGKKVAKNDLKRGDLMFFTNDSRKNNTGVERIGHVALYLGDNWILHTASDYAKIEQISAKRWSYFIQAQRML